MDNRKHMRTEKKTAVKNSFGRLLATDIFTGTMHGFHY